LNDFLALVSSYSVLSPDEQAQSLAAAADGTLGPKDPAKRREAKIRQYKREREIREQLSVIPSVHDQFIADSESIDALSRSSITFINSSGVHPLPPSSPEHSTGSDLHLDRFDLRQPRRSP
jgi:hypothetical protein